MKKEKTLTRKMVRTESIANTRTHECVQITSSAQIESAKELIACYISDYYTKTDMTQEKFGELIGFDQSKVSSLINKKLKQFGLERMINKVILLGFSVDLSVSKRK